MLSDLKHCALPFITLRIVKKPSSIKQITRIKEASVLNKGKLKVKYLILPNDSQVLFDRQTEAVAQRCSVKKLFLEISQNSQENICARASFLITFYRTPLVAASGQSLRVFDLKG